MNTNTIKIAAKKTLGVIEQNSPAILTGLGTVGIITTAVFAVQATPKALELIDAKAHENGFEPEVNDPAYGWGLAVLKPVELVQTTWKCYVPAVAMGTVTIACFIGAHKISTTRNAALASLYSLTEKTFKDYRENVIKRLGEKEEKEIHDEVVEKRLVEAPIGEGAVIQGIGGNYLCYDTLTGRYFRSDRESIRSAVNDLNKQLIDEVFVDMNDLYYALGLPQVEIGKQLGWNTDKMLDIDFVAKVATNGEPCIVLDYIVLPTSDFRRFY